MDGMDKYEFEGKRFGLTLPVSTPLPALTLLVWLLTEVDSRGCMAEVTKVDIWESSATAMLTRHQQLTILITLLVFAWGCTYYYLLAQILHEIFSTGTREKFFSASKR